MKTYNQHAKWIALSGMLMALGLSIGWFYIPILGRNIYIVAIAIFLMPLILPIGYTITTAAFTVALSDIITGWAQWSWVSVIAYVAGVTIIWFFAKSGRKILFIVGMLIASSVISFVYYILFLIIEDNSVAIMSIFGNLIQAGITIPISTILYFPIKKISKSFEK